MQLKLPILSLPFILVTSLFLKLRNNSGNKTSSQSPSVPSSQKQSQDYLANQFHLIPQVCIHFISFLFSYYNYLTIFFLRLVIHF